MRIKFLILILLLVVFVLGCSTGKKSQEYYTLCAADPQCYEQIKTSTQVSHDITKTALDSSMPLVNLNEAVSLTVGSLMGFLTGVWHGRKKAKA